MKRIIFLLVFIPALFMQSCSSDDKNKEEFEWLDLEIVNNLISSPAWLKEIVSSQTDTNGFFLGEVHAVTIQGENYILVTDWSSSNYCVASQLYDLYGKKVSCDTEFYKDFIKNEGDINIIKTIWSCINTD